jgi:hypothetical protein
MSLDHDLIFNGWFENHPSLQAPMPLAQGVESFVGSLWPMGVPYTNPLNAIWSMQIADVHLLRSRRHWFLRDGLVPLMWFFKRHPKAPAFDTTILIDEAFAHFVPVGWREKVGTYRLHSEVAAQPNSRTALIGLASESYASVPFVQKQLPKILENERKHGSTAVDLFMPARMTWAHDEREHSLHANYFRELFRLLPDDTRIMNRGELAGTFDANKIRVCDLNEKLMVADNGLVSALLAKGAQLGDLNPPEKGEEFRKISPYHGFVINWRIGAEADQNVSRSLKSVSRFHGEIEDVFNQSPVFQAFPWPRWFAEWTRSNASEQPVTKAVEVDKAVVKSALARQSTKKKISAKSKLKPGRRTSSGKSKKH